MDLLIRFRRFYIDLVNDDVYYFDRNVYYGIKLKDKISPSLYVLMNSIPKTDKCSKLINID